MLHHQSAPSHSKIAPIISSLHSVYETLEQQSSRKIYANISKSEYAALQALEGALDFFTAKNISKNRIVNRLGGGLIVIRQNLSHDALTAQLNVAENYVSVDSIINVKFENPDTYKNFGFTGNRILNSMVFFMNISPACSNNLIEKSLIKIDCKNANSSIKNVSLINTAMEFSYDGKIMYDEGRVEKSPSWIILTGSSVTLQKVQIRGRIELLGNNAVSETTLDSGMTVLDAGIGLHQSEISLPYFAHPNKITLAVPRTTPLLLNGLNLSTKYGSQYKGAVKISLESSAQQISFDKCQAFLWDLEAFNAKAPWASSYRLEISSQKQLASKLPSQDVKNCQ